MLCEGCLYDQHLSLMLLHYLNASVTLQHHHEDREIGLGMDAAMGLLCVAHHTCVYLALPSSHHMRLAVLWTKATSYEA